MPRRVCDVPAIGGEDRPHDNGGGVRHSRGDRLVSPFDFCREMRSGVSSRGANWEDVTVEGPRYPPAGSILTVSGLLPLLMILKQHVQSAASPIEKMAMQPTMIAMLRTTRGTSRLGGGAMGGGEGEPGGDGGSGGLGGMAGGLAPEPASRARQKIEFATAAAIDVFASRYEQQCSL